MAAGTQKQQIQHAYALSLRSIHCAVTQLNIARMSLLDCGVLLNAQADSSESEVADIYFDSGVDAREISTLIAYLELRSVELKVLLTATEALSKRAEQRNILATKRTKDKS